MKKDYRNKPVRKMAVVAESNGYGVCAIDPRNQWVQTLANLIRDFQDEGLEVLNNSIPGSVISPRNPSYDILPEGSLPSALERYVEQLIKPQPDLAVIAYGLNDARSGNPVESFIEDLEKIVSDTIKRTKALLVVATPYWNTQFNEKLWKKHKPEWSDDPVWCCQALTGDELVCSYVSEIRKLCERHDCLCVDLYNLTKDCLWLLHDDQVHFNDVGHRIIGQAVFNVIASNCSFIAKKSIRQYRRGQFDHNNTGGTQCLSRMTAYWLSR